MALFGRKRNAAAKAQQAGEWDRFEWEYQTAIRYMVKSFQPQEDFLEVSLARSAKGKESLSLVEELYPTFWVGVTPARLCTVTFSFLAPWSSPPEICSTLISEVEGLVVVKGGPAPDLSMVKFTSHDGTKSWFVGDEAAHAMEAAWRTPELSVVAGTTHAVEGQMEHPTEGMAHFTGKVWFCEVCSGKIVAEKVDEPTHFPNRCPNCLRLVQHSIEAQAS